MFHGQDVVYNDLGEEMLLHAFDGKPAKLQAMLLIIDGSPEHDARVVWVGRVIWDLSNVLVYINSSCLNCFLFSLT